MATVAFDLNGTLMDPAALAEPLEEPLGGDAPARQLILRALDLAVTQGMALTLTGTFRPFKELLDAGLRRELTVAGHDAQLADAALQRAAFMPAFPEADAAIAVLHGAGHRVAVVTNSATSDAERVLENAGLRGKLAAVVGTDQARAFKPGPAVYANALEKLDVEAGDLWLVAAHWWDILGARRCGLRTAWIARKERELLSTVDADVRAADLREAAEGIVAATA